MDPDCMRLSAIESQHVHLAEESRTLRSQLSALQKRLQTLEVVSARGSGQVTQDLSAMQHIQLPSAPSGGKIVTPTLTVLSDKETTKTGRQGKQMILTDECRPEYLEQLARATAKVTAKVDGTSCYIGPLTHEMASFIQTHSSGLIRGDRLLVTHDSATRGASSFVIGHVTAFRRLDVKLKKLNTKKGKSATLFQPGWFPSSPPNEETGHWVGFRLVFADEGEKQFVEAMDVTTQTLKLLSPEGIVESVAFDQFQSGATVELLGPKLNGNRHKLSHHCVMKHGEIDLSNEPALTTLLRPVDGRIDLPQITQFIVSHPEYEGIVVWFLASEGRERNHYFKLHRGHLGLGDDWGGSLVYK
eukprot:m.133107 g.133107  ORF g.133107 m.133107 type:complete len:358 (-) comp29653_c0_seq4:51-1124(-)